MKNPAEHSEGVGKLRFVKCESIPTEIRPVNTAHGPHGGIIEDQLLGTDRGHGPMLYQINQPIGRGNFDHISFFFFYRLQVILSTAHGEWR